MANGRYDYDLFTIGAGSGGTRAARMAAAAGARVAVAEERYLGGTCVNVGCVPKKLLVYASHFADDFEDARGFGWHTERPEFDWRALIENKNTEIERLNGVYQRLIEGAGAQIFDERAIVVDAHTVEVGDRRITAERILVATGSWPVLPDAPGVELAVTSNEMFHLERPPRRLLVVGGGYIGVEFAGILAGLGSEVTLLHRGELFLRGFDQDLRENLALEMRHRGIKLLFNSLVDSVARAEDGSLRATVNDGTVIECDLLLCAIGRRPNTNKLGLEEAGVELDDSGAVVVNDTLQSSVPSIYALGDVINRAPLTPVAIAEAMVFVDNVYRGANRRMDYSVMPTAVFSQPPLASVGLPEHTAREAHDVKIFRSHFRPMKNTLSGRDERTLLKLIVDANDDRVLGCHMLGPDSAEIIQALGVAIAAGATKADFDRTIALHPTTAEEFVTMREPLA